MSLRLGDVAPDFTAETTEGIIDFHDWLGNGWGILFSHPADFTPVCTTELGAMSNLTNEFKKET
jgi:alkyl hydroperoxide reductase subunit AhpC